MTRRRRSLVLLGAAAAVVLGVALVLQRDDAAAFRARKGHLIQVATRPSASEAPLESRVDVTLTSDTGLVVEGAVVAPPADGQRRAAVVLLGGNKLGRGAAEVAAGQGLGDLVILALDYRIAARPGYTPLAALADAPTLRRQALDVVPSVLLAMDYVISRPDVDPARVVLLGYSLGALFVPCVASLDRRVAVAAMVDGGGDLGALVRAAVDFEYDPVTSYAAGALAGWLFRPLEPLRWAGTIAPVPFVMINSRRDDRIPAACVFALYHRARQPKRFVWLDAAHVSPKDTELIHRTTRQVRRALRDFKVLD